MRKHGGTPSRRDKHVTLAAISPPGVARGRFIGGQQSGLAGSKPPPLFTREASSCSSQGRRQGEPWGASPRPRAPTLPTLCLDCRPTPSTAAGGSVARSRGRETRDPTSSKGGEGIRRSCLKSAGEGQILWLLGVPTSSGHINLVDAAGFINQFLMERIICWIQGIFDILFVCI